MDRRVALVGIDGFAPAYLDRYLARGRLPALGALAGRGASAALVSTLPATTPVAWASIATGAPPSVTGIEGFLVHRPGTRLDERMSGCYAHRCGAEPIWDTATRVGLRSYVVKFPLSYPSAGPTLRVDGAAGWGGLRCLHEAASRGTATVRLDAESRGTVRIPALWRQEDVTLRAALRRDGAGPVLHLADEADRPLGALRPGEWSEPLVVTAPARGGPAEVAFRVKLLDCATAEVRLFHTALHEVSGHATPPAAWDRLRAATGPIEEQTEPSLTFDGSIDLDTQFELFRLNVDWLKRASAAILDRGPWDLFAVHVHVVDWAHHLLHGAVDPRHPDFDERTARDYGELLLAAYRMADELVATVTEAAGSGADVVVVGDHGQDLQRTTLRTNEWLAAEGLLRWAGEAGDDVDWDATSAYATGNYVHLNVFGREPTGILTEREARDVRDRVVDGLLGLVDPDTGDRPVLVAGPKEHFALLGADGPGVGDVVFCTRSGYAAANDRGAVLTPTRALREFTSNHDHFWPLDPAIHTRLIGAGPGLRAGYARSRLGRVEDVAPTLAALLGIPAPAQSAGRVLDDLCAEPALVAT